MRKVISRYSLALMPILFAIGIGYGMDTVLLKGNHPPDAERLRAVGDADPTQRLSMQIHFAARNQTELHQLLADQQNPSSPNFHKWLATGEYDRRFGPRQQDLDAVAQWLRGRGFMVDSTSRGAIDFSGTVAQAENAFAVQIKRFGDGSTYANLDDPTIPLQFDGLIANISGLDNMMRAVPVGPRRALPTSH
jgi:pseudomonalisin